MQRRNFLLLGLLVMLTFGVSVEAKSNGQPSFKAWLVGVKDQARREGIAPEVFKPALADLELDEQVIALDRKQPENKITLDRYLNNTINDRRVNKGREMMREHAGLLKTLSERYGVQPKYIVALWAIESDYGNNQGNFSVIRSLATLAYEGRRADFFRGELIAALKILEAEGVTSETLEGSWAGAMGGSQFMPSTYLRYAADGDGDGHRDIWSSTPDMLASIASYLQALNWNDQLDVLEPCATPDDFKKSETSLEHGRSAEYWGKRGFVLSSGGDYAPITPGGPRILYAIYLSKEDEAENAATLVTSNFKALLQWNRSRYFATAVGSLAEAIGDES